MYLLSRAFIFALDQDIAHVVNLKAPVKVGTWPFAKEFNVDDAKLIYLPRLFQQNYGFRGLAHMATFNTQISKGTLLTLGLELIDSSLLLNAHTLPKDIILDRSRALIRTMAQLLRKFINDATAWNTVVNGKFSLLIKALLKF